MPRIIKIFTLSVFIANVSYAQKTFDEHVRSHYEGSVELIYADELGNAMSSENIYLLDTRTKEEFEVSHIEGAQFVDYDGFKKADVKDIPKNAKVVVYCSIGYRSERIGEKMKKMGFEDVSNLYGGIFDWKNTDHEVVNDLDQPTDSVHTYNFIWSMWLKNGIKVY